MKLPLNLTFESLCWLLDLDLSDYKRCGELRLVEVAEHYCNDEPWRSIVAPNYRIQAILIGLQNELRREALKRCAEEAKGLRAQIAVGHTREQSLKAALEAQILRGAILTDYANCWVAYFDGDEAKMHEAMAKVERKRTEWRFNCEREAKAAKQARLKHDAETLRNRAPGFTVKVNWFVSMPVYNHIAHNKSAPWGYCQATGQDRWKVKDFLRAKKQTPVKKTKHKGAGKPLDLYGFETNLLVLDKWLGDWLLNSRNDDWEYQDTNASGKTFWVSKPERVCETIYETVWHTACEEHTNVQAERLRAVMRKHLMRWKGRVKDPDTRRIIPFLAATLAPEGRAWRDFAQERRMQWAEFMAKVRSENQPVSGPKPYADVSDAYERLRELLG